MIIVFFAIVAVLSVPLTGRSLAPLADLSLRRVWLVWLSLGVQVAIISVFRLPNWLGQPLHLGTYALSAAFLWSNRHLPGVWMLALGASLNLSAIVANGGTMPASESAWRTAGLKTVSGEFENSNVTRSARLPWLGDVFAIPKGWPLANVFSVGDVVIVVAIAYFVHVWCRRTPVGEDASNVTESTLAAAG
jgi:hypothetical protein